MEISNQLKSLPSLQATGLVALAQLAANEIYRVLKPDGINFSDTFSATAFAEWNNEQQAKLKAANPDHEVNKVYGTQVSRICSANRNKWIECKVSPEKVLYIYQALSGYIPVLNAQVNAAVDRHKALLNNDLPILTAQQSAA